MRVYFLCYLGIISCLGYGLYQDNSLDASMVRGKTIYHDFCVTCHLPDGKGVEGTFPPLAQSDYLKNNRAASIRGIKYGQRGEIVVNGNTYNNTMMPMGLADDEIADVMNYVNHSWGNDFGKKITAEEVAGTGPR